MLQRGNGHMWVHVDQLSSTGGVRWDKVTLSLWTISSADTPQTNTSSTIETSVIHQVSSQHHDRTSVNQSDVVPVIHFARCGSYDSTCADNRAAVNKGKNCRKPTRSTGATFKTADHVAKSMLESAQRAQSNAFARRHGAAEQVNWTCLSLDDAMSQQYRVCTSRASLLP
jgi:hypothetical protein